MCKREPKQGEREMMQRIGIALMSYLIGHTPYQDLIALSQLAEEQGFNAVVFPTLHRIKW